MSVTKKRKQRRLLKTWCVCKNKKMTGFKWNTLFEPDLKFMGKNLYILITIIWCCAVMNSNLRTFFAVFRDALLITIITPACSSLHQLLLYPARLKPIPTLSLNQCWDIREGQSSRNYFFLFFLEVTDSLQVIRPSLGTNEQTSSALLYLHHISVPLNLELKAMSSTLQSRQ